MTAAPSAVDKAIATFANLSREGVGEEGAEGMEPEMVQEVQEKLKYVFLSYLFRNSRHL